MLETTRTCSAVSVPSCLAPSFTCVVIGWRVVAPMNCSALVNSHITGRPVLIVASSAKILGQHLLLAAEAAADPLGEDLQLAVEQAEQIAKLLLGDERRLRARAHMQPAVLALPGDGAMRLQMHLLRPRGRIGHIMHGVGLGEALRDIAEFAMNVDIDVVAIGNAFLVQDRRPGFHGELRIEDRRQQLIVDLEQAAGLLCRGLGFGHHGGDPLADEADDVVEHVGVVWIDEMVLMRCRRVEFARHVLPGDRRRRRPARPAPARA